MSRPRNTYTIDQNEPKLSLDERRQLVSEAERYYGHGRKITVDIEDLTIYKKDLVQRNIERKGKIGYKTSIYFRNKKTNYINRQIIIDLLDKGKLNIIEDKSEIRKLSKQSIFRTNKYGPWKKGDSIPLNVDRNSLGIKGKRKGQLVSNTIVVDNCIMCECEKTVKYQYFLKEHWCQLCASCNSVIKGKANKGKKYKRRTGKL